MMFFSLTEHCRENCWYPKPEHFVFQYCHRFFCVSYCPCMNGYDHLDWKMTLIKSVAKKCGLESSLERPYGPSKSNVLKELIKERNNSYLIEKPMTEVCYLYSNNAGKDYYLGDTRPFREHLSTLISYRENITSAMKAIKDKENHIYNHESIIQKISDLRYCNKDHYEELSDVQKIDLTKLLSKNFIKNQLA